MRIGPVDRNLCTDSSTTRTVTAEATVVSSESALDSESPSSFMRWSRGGRGVTWLEYDFGAARQVDTVVLAGLTMEYNTRIRILFSNTGGFYETLTPDAVTDVQGLTHTLADVQEAPDDDANVRFPARLGTGVTQARIGFPSASGTTRDTDTTDPLHVYRIRKGRNGDSLGGLNTQLEPHFGGGLNGSGFVSNRNGGNFAQIADGGQVSEYYLDGQQFTSNPELYYNRSGSASFYAAVASARIMAAMDVVDADTYWWQPRPDMTAVGLTNEALWGYLLGVLHDGSTVLRARQNVVYPFQSTQTYRYMRIEIDSNPDAPVELSYVAAGRSLTLTHGFRSGASAMGQMDTNQIVRGASQVPQISVGARLKYLDLALQAMPESDMLQLRALLDFAGAGRFLWVTTDEQAAGSTGLYSGGIQRDTQWFGNLWGTVRSNLSHSFFIKRPTDDYYRARESLRVDEALDRDT